MTPSQAAQRLRNIERALKQAEATADPVQIKAFLLPIVRQQVKEARRVLTRVEK